jgi:seryl-tRNA synthetase
MLDIKFIRENADKVKLAAKQKNINLDLDLLLKIDGERNDMMRSIDELRSRRNEIAAMSKNSKPTPEMISE